VPLVCQFPLHCRSGNFKACNAMEPIGVDPMVDADKNDDQEQAARFERTAREHGVEVDEKGLAETLRRMAKREKEKKSGQDE
jgi:hypothetical protein